ncbi:MAG: N-acetylmuramoyl-L-alanine amidase [Bacteroidetes bacterium]|nr:N-acetylmuramoyl-L-alanine amidase [Bacteroidota bacterium]
MSRTGKNINTIFIHCTAGYSGLDGLKKHWKSLGWNSPGYHLLVDLEGEIIEVTPFANYSNGVKGHNTNSINIAYIGGVDPKNVTKALDSRTPEQKEGLLKAIEKAINWVVKTGGSKANLKIMGHRDVSPDKNGNGVIDSFERIKECPSFDAIPEYKNLLK